MKRWFLPLVLVVFGLAALLRLPGLGDRPMHNDEGVNGIKIAELWDTGKYHYDPNEHHGPTLYYATLALGKLTGGPATSDDLTDTRLRLVTVLFGLGLVLLLPLMADGLGRRGVVWAALFLAVSPAMVFYSRYYIHEMLLAFFTLLAIAAAWRYWRTRRIAWAALAGAGLGLMHATKETFVLTLAAAGAALVLSLVWARFLDASKPPVPPPPLNWKHVAAGLGVWIAVAFVLFSSFLTNLAGPLDSIRTYAPWLHRAGGESPHIHPWYFYLQRLLYFHPGKGPAWTEAFVLVLAVTGAWAGFCRKHLGRGDAGFVRFLAFYSVLLAGIYSVIPYKTPWCLLSFWLSAILLAGFGAAVLIRDLWPPSTRLAVVALILAGTAHLGWQARQLSGPYAADQRNPHVYAHTSPDVLALVQRVKDLAAAHPDGRNLLVKVIAPDGDYWPLPWYLRACKHTGWWETLPADPYAPIMIVSSKLDARLDEKKTHVMTGYYQLRPKVFLELYVDLNLWKSYLAQHPPRPEPE